MRVALLEVDHWHVGMYAEPLAEIDGVEVVAVSNADYERARTWGETIGCASYPSAGELLNSEQIDIAFGFAPHHRMFELAELLVDREQAFAMEKPMSLDAGELATLVPRIESSGMFAGVAFVRRLGGYGGALLRMREELGEIYSFQGRFVGGPMRRYVDDGCPWMLRRELAGGGCMINFGTHFIDLFQQLVAEPITRVFCQTNHRLHGESVEDLASLLLQTASGATATLESGYLLPSEPKEDTISVSAEHAYVGNEGTKWGGPTFAFRDGRTVKAPEREPDYSDYVRDVVARFRAGDRPLADVASMVRVLSCVNAAYASAESGLPTVPQAYLD
jgi:predicted dehydrogenase